MAEQEYITHWHCNYCPKCGAQMDESEDKNEIF